MNKKRSFTEYEAIHIFTKILIGLQYLHSRGILHRDLKPSNILVDYLNGYQFFKISDFGISKDIFQKNSTEVTYEGRTTPDYLAPEVYNQQKETQKVDMWALGIMLYKFLSEMRHPFKNSNVHELRNSVLNDEPAELPLTVSPFLR